MPDLPQSASWQFGSRRRHCCGLDHFRYFLRLCHGSKVCIKQHKAVHRNVQKQDNQSDRSLQEQHGECSIKQSFKLNLWWNFIKKLLNMVHRTKKGQWRPTIDVGSYSISMVYRSIYMHLVFLLTNLLIVISNCVSGFITFDRRHDSSRLLLLHVHEARYKFESETFYGEPSKCSLLQNLRPVVQCKTAGELCLNQATKASISFSLN